VPWPLGRAKKSPQSLDLIGQRVDLGREIPAHLSESLYLVEQQLRLVAREGSGETPPQTNQVLVSHHINDRTSVRL